MLALPGSVLVHPVPGPSAATTPTTESPMQLQPRARDGGAVHLAAEVLGVVPERGDPVLGGEVEERHAPDAEEPRGAPGAELAPAEAVEHDERAELLGERRRRPVTGHGFGELNGHGDRHRLVLSGDHSPSVRGVPRSSVGSLWAAPRRTPPAPPPVRPRGGVGIADPESPSAMIVVSDTTPLLHLARAGLLHLVPGVHGEVRVPRTVWRELVDGCPDALEVVHLIHAKAVGWLRVEDGAEETDAYAELVGSVDEGEAAAIALAEHLHAGLLLVDDRDGREAAADRGLPIRGTLGILLEAKRARVLDEVRPALAALLETGLRVSLELQAEVLKRAGE